MVVSPTRRLLVRQMTSLGLGERRASQVLRMGVCAFRYDRAPDPRNASLRELMLVSAQRHHRHGADNF